MHRQMNVLLVSALLIIFGMFYVHGDVSHLPDIADRQPVTETCLGCICEAATNCNQTLKCSGEVCGLFAITWAYWADAGKPTLNGESVDSPTAYGNCANDPRCAAQCVQGYMVKFGQDCNGDGRVNCYDHAAIHNRGGYGCRNPLPEKYSNTFNQCLEHVIAAQG